MFRGGFEHNVDEKGRVTLPLKFRSSLGERFIITKGLGGCLFVLTDEQWREEFEKMFTRKPVLDTPTRLLQRFFCAEALDTSVDSQGRVALPSGLRDHASIELQTDVLITGCINRLEIWSKKRWNDLRESFTDEALELAAKQLATVESGSASAA